MGITKAARSIITLIKHPIWATPQLPIIPLPPQSKCLVAMAEPEYERQYKRQCTTSPRKKKDTKRKNIYNNNQQVNGASYICGCFI